MISVEVCGLVPNYTFRKIYWNKTILNSDSLTGSADQVKLNEVFEGRAFALILLEDKKRIELEELNGFVYTIDGIPLEQTSAVLPLGKKFMLGIKDIQFTIEGKDHPVE